MASPLRLYYAYLAEPAPLGARRDRAPAHLTLVPPFTATTEAAHDALRDAVFGRRPFEVVATERAHFGPRGDVPVQLVAPVEGLRELHERLITELEARSVALLNANHIHDRFAPHIRLRPKAPDYPSFQPGQSFTIDHVALVRSGDGATTVVATETLPG